MQSFAKESHGITDEIYDKIDNDIRHSSSPMPFYDDVAHAKHRRLIYVISMPFTIVTGDDFDGFLSHLENSSFALKIRFAIFSQSRFKSRLRIFNFLTMIRYLPSLCPAQFTSRPGAATLINF
jgi:hypothetical protein